jgi:hypothetical protein
MRKFEFWQKWLLYVFILQAVGGLIVCFAGPTYVFGPAYVYYKQAIWGVPTVPESSLVFHDWIYGVLGATLASWAVAMAIVTQYPFKNKEAWAWWCILVSLLVWFVPDTAITLNHGIWPNVIFNVCAFFINILPLVFTKAYFKRG